MSALYPSQSLAYLGVLLVFFRLLGLFLFVPGFSHSAIPVQVKVLLALTVSLALFPVVKKYVPIEDHSLSMYMASVIRESAVGLLMGFVAFVTFEAISLGAQFVGYQMGLGTASMMDPENSAQVSAMVPFQAWIALMLFFAADMHHQMLHLFTESFRITSSMTTESFSNPALLKFFVGITAKLFGLAVQIAAPITLLILSCNIVIGMLSRMMPQMNILLFSFPITLLLGFAGLYLVAPELLDTVEAMLGEISTEMMQLIRIL
jgi:flagellar biosynthesis protein FliR